MSEFLTVAFAHAIAVATPGPDFALVLRYSVAQGAYAGRQVSLGIAMGIAVHMTYCVFGLAVITRLFDSYVDILKIVGALFMLYLAVLSFRHKDSSVEYINSELDLSYTTKRLILLGFLTNGLNLKATLFFLALFALVIDQGTPLSTLLGYGAYFILATYVWFRGLSLFLTRATVRSFFLRNERAFNVIMGLVFVFFAAQFLFAAT